MCEENSEQSFLASTDSLKRSSLCALRAQIPTTKTFGVADGLNICVAVIAPRNMHPLQGCLAQKKQPPPLRPQ